MIISCAWLRILSETFALPHGLIRESKRAGRLKRPITSKVASPRSLYAQYSSFDRCQKTAILHRPQGSCLHSNPTDLLHACVHRPYLAHLRPPRIANTLQQCQRLTGVRACGRRCFLTSSLGTVLTPPAVFIGLVVALWLYKCCMMVVFQNKIIYMPSVPPFSRQEQISTYESETKPVVWSHEMIQSLDGTQIALCVGSLRSSALVNSAPFKPENGRHLYVVYFQGNASSLPPRLPMLTGVLRAICSEAGSTTCTIVALSYRGYWKSSGRASQPGIEKDAAATINWVQRLRTDGGDSNLVIWGQSIGAGVATRAVANYLGQSKPDSPQIDGLVLETPFTSIKSMLQELYPQKWLPYRYLWPFLRNWWDNVLALREIKETNGPRDLLILTAGKDEVVPADHGRQLADLSSELGFNVHHQVVPGTYHHEVMARREGKACLAKFLAALQEPNRQQHVKT